MNLNTIFTYLKKLREIKREEENRIAEEKETEVKLKLRAEDQFISESNEAMQRNHCPIVKTNCTKHCIHFQSARTSYMPTSFGMVRDYQTAKCKLWK